MDKVYIVTGAKGHLGNHVVRKLLDRDETVIPLALPGDTSPALDDVCNEMAWADICQPEQLEKVFVSCREQYPLAELYVIHAAGIVTIGSKYQEIVQKVNVEGTRNVVKMCEKYSVRRLVYVSSVHAIPEKEKGEPSTEIVAFHPHLVRGLYAKTKAQATQIVLDAVSEGLNAVVVHPSGIIGPEDYCVGHTSQLIIDYLEGKLVAGVKGGFDFVDVRDVADGILRACDQGRTGEAYILSNRYVDVIELLNMLHNATGQRRIATVLPLFVAKATAPLAELYYKILKQKPLYTKYSLFTLQGNALFSHDKATRELGYHPRPIEETVQDSADWLLKTGRARLIKRGKQHRHKAVIKN